MTPKVNDSRGLSACGDRFAGLHGIGIYFALIGAPKQAKQAECRAFWRIHFAPETQELRKVGIRIRLEGQPLAILQMLLDGLGGWSRVRSCREDCGRRIHLLISNIA